MLWFRNALSTAGNSMTSSQRLSPEPLLKKRSAPSRTGGGGILEMLWKPQMPLIIVFGASQPYSRREFQGTLWERFPGLSGIIPEFLLESASRTGGEAQWCSCGSTPPHPFNRRRREGDGTNSWWTFRIFFSGRGMGRGSLRRQDSEGAGVGF